MTAAVQNSLQSIDLPGLFAPQREFVLHNATDEDITIQYDGESFIVPAFNKVVEHHPKYKDVFASAEDSDGQYIPGTLLIRDIDGDRNANSDGGRGNRWDAAQAIKHCLGIDPKDKKASSPWYKRGISVMPANPTKELVTLVQSEGRKRYASFRVEADRALVNSYQERAAKHRALGLHPSPPTAEYYDAENRLKLYYESIGQMSSVPTTDVTNDPDFIEFGKALAKSIALETVKETPSVDVGDLIDKLLADSKFVDQLEKKFKAQKAKGK